VSGRALYCRRTCLLSTVDDITNCLSFGQQPLIIMYADGIILVAPSVCVLQKLLDKCEQELNWLGMSINAKKSCCMRVGPRCDAVCAIASPQAVEDNYHGLKTFAI